MHWSYAVIHHWVIEWHDINGLVQDCSNSIANALELLQSCTKPSIQYIENNDTDNYMNPGYFTLAAIDLKP